MTTVVPVFVTESRPRTAKPAAVPSGTGVPTLAAVPNGTGVAVFAIAGGAATPPQRDHGHEDTRQPGANDISRRQTRSNGLRHNIFLFLEHCPIRAHFQ